MYVLHILTHGRRYQEEYATLEEATVAALALEHEPRERAEQITRGNELVLDRVQIEQLMKARR